MIQLSIKLGGLFGGVLLDGISLAAPLVGRTVFLALATVAVGNGDRLSPESVTG